MDNLPQLQIADVVCADEIILTGGEPMLDPLNIQYYTRTLRSLNPKLKVYMYTSKCKPPASLIAVMECLDGITLTLHDKKDVPDFQVFYDWMQFRPSWYSTKSLRLNYFPEDGVDMTGVKTEGWTVEALEWLDDCPVPEHEVLMRWGAPSAKEHQYRRKFHERNGLLQLHEKPA